jgi:hypothetical protein
MPLVGDRAIDARAIGKRSDDALADSSLPVLRRDEAFLCEGAGVLKAQVAPAALTGQRVRFQLERPEPSLRLVNRSRLVLLAVPADGRFHAPLRVALLAAQAAQVAAEIRRDLVSVAHLSTRPEGNAASGLGTGVEPILHIDLVRLQAKETLECSIDVAVNIVGCVYGELRNTEQHEKEMST